MPYAPATDVDLREMLATIGVGSVDELFAAVPPAARPSGDMDLPLGVGEQELMRTARGLALRNLDLSAAPSFLGVGSYDHYVPAVCRAITSRSEFATAYTPYQPEISQGTLQSIFEFQSSIAALTGLPVANASLYDGATAAAEAVYLSEQTTRRARVVVLETVSPQVRAVVDTYAAAYGMVVTVVPFDPATGVTDPAALETALGGSEDVAAVLVQQPNAFGRFEDAPALVAAADAVGAVPVVHADPISLGILEAPGAYGAGVVIGDGQPLGQAPTSGGPSFGFMAAQERFLRRMPGRIVGATVDGDGVPGYVLTFQTREQHIRREKATSNICTNQALCALAGLVYLSWVGPYGLQDLGELLVDRASVARRRLAEIPGVRVAHEGGVFREFLVELPADAERVAQRCADRGVLAGWPAARGWSGLGAGALLVAATEQRTDADIELLAATIEQAVAEVGA